MGGMGVVDDAGILSFGFVPSTSQNLWLTGILIGKAAVGEGGGEEVFEPDSIDMASGSFSCVVMPGYSFGVYRPRRPHLPNVGPMRAITVACATYHLRAAYRFWTTRTRTCPWDRVSPPAT